VGLHIGKAARSRLALVTSVDRSSRRRAVAGSRLTPPLSPPHRSPASPGPDAQRERASRLEVNPRGRAGARRSTGRRRSSSIPPRRRLPTRRSWWPPRTVAYTGDKASRERGRAVSASADSSRRPGSFGHQRAPPRRGGRSHRHGRGDGRDVHGALDVFRRVVGAGLRYAQHPRHMRTTRSISPTRWGLTRARRDGLKLAPRHRARESSIQGLEGHRPCQVTCSASAPLTFPRLGHVRSW